MSIDAAKLIAVSSRFLLVVTMFFNSEPKMPFVFDANELEQLALKYQAKYAVALPFKHIVLDDFLPELYAESLLRNFPSPSSDVWFDWRERETVHQSRKQGAGHASRMTNLSPYIHNVLQAFNSYPFLNFLEKLTGIQKILPDPYFHGGGVHQILPEGKLAIHTDFNDHHRLNLYRCINVLFYLNKDWKETYNGNLELWAGDLSKCEKSILPIFNRLVIFNTNKKSFHGHPKPLKTPNGITRKSLALYYYTALPISGEKYDGNTDWQEVNL